MEKQTKKDYKLLIILILLVLLAVPVGYAALSQTLTINGTAGISSEWNVKFKSITLASSSGATEAEATPSLADDKVVATFDVTLEKPGAYAEYTVIVENAGTINAKLYSITDLTTINAEAPTDIVYSITGPAVNDELNANAEHTYTVRVEWDADSTAIPTEKEKTATIELVYDQAD